MRENRLHTPDVKLVREDTETGEVGIFTALTEKGRDRLTYVLAEFAQDLEQEYGSDPGRWPPWYQKVEIADGDPLSVRVPDEEKLATVTSLNCLMGGLVVQLKDGSLFGGYTFEELMDWIRTLPKELQFHFSVDEDGLGTERPQGRSADNASA
jgi:hypothetical protein